MAHFKTWKGSYNGFHSAVFRILSTHTHEEKSYIMIDTGQSGDVLSPHYDDLLSKNRELQFLELYAVNNTPENKLILKRN